MNIPEDEINSYLKSVDNEDDNDVYHRLDIIDLPSRYPVHNDQQTWYFPKFGRWVLIVYACVSRELQYIAILHK